MTIEEIINTPRDIQHEKIIKCKCGNIPHIAETMARDRYKVRCFICNKETNWHSKIDNAVMDWNNNLKE